MNPDGDSLLGAQFEHLLVEPVEPAEAPAKPKSESKTRCTLHTHDWVLSDRATHETCKRCRTRFPCTHDCQHLDCIVVTGRPLPECTVINFSREEFIKDETRLHGLL